MRLEGISHSETIAYIAFKKRNKQREIILLRSLSEHFDVAAEGQLEVPPCLSCSPDQFVVLQVKKEAQAVGPPLLLTNYEENEPR